MHQPVGLVQDGAGEGQALLFVAGELLRPTARSRRADRRAARGRRACSASRDRVVGEGVGRRPDRRPPRAACRSAGTAGGRETAAAPAAGSSMRPLPNGQMPAMARNSVVFTTPAGPSRATRSPAATAPFRSAASTCAVGLAQRRGRPERRAASALGSMRMPSGRSSSCARALEHLAERRQALDAGAPCGDLLVGVDEPRERARDLAVGDAGLGDAAERHAAGEERRRGDQQRHDAVGLADAAGEQGQIALRDDQLPPVGDDVAEAVERAAAARPPRRAPTPPPRRGRESAPARSGSRPRSAGGRS